MGCAIAAGAALGAIGDIAGPLISGALAPGVPKTAGISSKASSAEYGVNPNFTLAMSQLQTALSTATTDEQRSKIQDQITQLQQKQSNLATTGNVQQFLGNLGSELPQLQGLANSQNQSSTQGALGLQQQFGLPAGQAFLGAQQQLAPQFYAGQQQLGQEAFGTPLGLSPQQTQYFSNQLNAQQAQQGLYGSPLSAQNTALNLTGLNLQQANTQMGQQQSFLNNYLQPQLPNLFSGASSPVSATQLGGASLNSLSPQDFLSLQAALSGLKFNQGTQQAQAIGGGIQSAFNAFGGSGGGSASSIFGGGTTGGGSSGGSNMSSFSTSPLTLTGGGFTG